MHWGVYCRSNKRLEECVVKCRDEAVEELREVIGVRNVLVLDIRGSIAGMER